MPFMDETSLKMAAMVWSQLQNGKYISVASVQFIDRSDLIR